MSLFRLAIVLSLGIAVMPADEAQQRRLYENASTAAYWTMTFCDRNAATCETAGSLWGTFVKKAQFAGQLAYDMAERYASGGPGEPGAEPASYRSPWPGGSADSGTLNSGDLGPQWRGTAPRQGT